MTNYESKEIHDLEMEILKLKGQNKKLRQKLNKAKEALKFYANADVYEYYDKYEGTAVQHDGGEWARKVLDEIKDSGL